MTDDVGFSWQIFKKCCLYTNLILYYSNLKKQTKNNYLLKYKNLKKITV